MPFGQWVPELAAGRSVDLRRHVKINMIKINFRTARVFRRRRRPGWSSDGPQLQVAVH